MALYDAVADLPVVIDSESRHRQAAETTSGFERVTTEFHLSGDGVTGRGEDVTYDAADHDALASIDSFDLAGEWTIDSLSETLANRDLFPNRPPDQPSARQYRRFAIESAALDLALRQADTDLASQLGRSRDPVRFIVSTRLGDPPSIDRVERLLEIDPSLEFKLDPTPDWSDDVFAGLAATDAVRVLDLKGWYSGTDVDVPADPELYRDVLAAFPYAIVEDPAITPETRSLLDPQAERLAFDYPITGVGDLEELPIEPGWCNVKPSRFGSLQSLFETVEYCWEREIALYGGGQFELGVGRTQIQTIASICHPDGPNDVAPRAFNDPDYEGEYPMSPIEPSADPAGFSF